MGKPGVLQFVGWQRVRHDLATEQELVSLSFCCCSVARSCLSLCDPMNYSKPGLPILHYLHLQLYLNHLQSLFKVVVPVYTPSSFPHFHMALSNSKANVAKSGWQKHG